MNSFLRFTKICQHALAQVVRRMWHAPARSALPTLPRQVDAIVAKALADRAVDRYASAAALAADLRRAVSAIDARRAAIERRQ